MPLKRPFKRAIIAPMAEVNLTQEINNDNGYIDSVVGEIKNVPDGEPLDMLITCVGGDTFQGDRLHRAILEHQGKTKAIVIGLAASMGGVLLSAFDSVEIDVDADIMLHKAHIPNTPTDEITPEQNSMIERFNRRAFSRMSDSGVNEELLKDIFLSDQTKDFWLTAKEAEAAGIGQVMKIERKDSQPYKVAAKLDIKSIKNKYKQKEMGLFKSNKAALRMINAVDGRQVVFTSENEAVAKGDTLQLVGSNESLQGKIKLTDTLEATIDEENKIVDLVETEAEVDGDQIGELAGRIEAIEKALAELTKGGEEEETPEAKAAKEEEAAIEAKAVVEEEEEKEEEKKAMTALLQDALKAAKTIKAGLKLPTMDDKHETVVSNLTDREKNVSELISLRNDLAKKQN